MLLVCSSNKTRAQRTVEMERLPLSLRRSADSMAAVAVMLVWWLSVCYQCECVVAGGQQGLGNGDAAAANESAAQQWMREANSNLTLGVAVPAPSPTQQSQCSMSQLMDATAIRGWCCDCWNSTNPDVSVYMFTWEQCGWISDCEQSCMIVCFVY